MIWFDIVVWVFSKTLCSDLIAFEATVYGWRIGRYYVGVDVRCF